MLQSKKNVVFLWILVSSILGVGMVAWGNRIKKDWENLDAKSQALERTNQMLLEIQNSNFESNLLNDSCRIFLETKLDKYENRYVLEVAYYNLDDPNYNWRPVDEVEIDVGFPDKSWARMFFYEGGLVNCISYG